MPRLGHFTGQIYNDDTDFSKVGECCRILTRDEENNPEILEKIRIKNKVNCILCAGGCDYKQEIL